MRIGTISIKFWMIILAVVLTCAFTVLDFSVVAFAADTPGIDDDTVITVEQAGSIATSSGLYGWDSRGAVVNYHSITGSVSGTLGEVLFADRTGHRHNGLWVEWGKQFPDWWGRMLAEKIRSNVRDSEIASVRDAFSQTMIFDCTWEIAIGVKSDLVGGNLYKSLRTDDTLRPVYGVDLDTETVKERLFTGDEMSNSLSYILPGGTWGESSLATFRERNPYVYSVRINSFDIDVRATNCTVCAARGLADGSSACPHVRAGTFFNIRLPIMYDGHSYSGSKSFVWEGQSVTFNEPVIDGFDRNPSADDMSGMVGRISGNSMTPTGDSRIYIAYRERYIDNSPIDLTIKYLTLNDSGTAADKVVKTVTMNGAITKNQTFAISLADSVMADQVQYMLTEGAQTGLSYSSSPKYVNAVHGTKAYPITASNSSAGKITYATSQVYTSDHSGTLYIPVHLKMNPAPDEDTPGGGGGGGGSGGGGGGEDPWSGNVPDPHSSGTAYSSVNHNAAAAIKSEVYDVSNAIPSTENVYIEAQAQNYLYSLNAEVISGQWPVRVSVEMPYELIWEEDGEEKKETGSQYVTAVVYRDYSYVHLNSFAYYALTAINVGNPALAPVQTNIAPSVSEIAAPNCGNPVVYGSAQPVVGGNIDLPYGAAESIKGPIQYIEGNEKKPSIPLPDTAAAQLLAEAAIGEIPCRNDELIFGGVNVLGSIGWHMSAGYETLNTWVLNPSQVYFDTRELFGSNAITIPAKMRNGNYRTVGANVVYSPIIRYGGASIYYNPSISVNDISVHTPTLCELIMEECDMSLPNIGFNQETIKPDEAVFQIVTGNTGSYGLEGHENDSCDFLLKVSNTGTHTVYSERLGNNYNYFYNRSGNNGGRFIGVNEVRFGCDVILDVGNDRKVSNDRKIAAGEWFTTDNAEYRFYVPDYVSEGDYIIEARSESINALSRDDSVTRKYRNEALYLHENAEKSDYVTYDSAIVHVAGKMCGLKLTDVEDSSEWGNVFTKGKEDGTLKSILPKGNVKLQALSEYTFYYTAGLRNELGIDTGRHSRFILPLIPGSNPNASLQNLGMLKPGYNWKFALLTTGTRMKGDDAAISIQPVFRWISEDGVKNLDASIGYERNYSQYGRDAVYAHKDEHGSGDYRQNWTFDYALPSRYVVMTGDTVREDGYLVIGFDIAAYDSESTYYLNYVSPFGYCNMWAVEGQQPNRRDYYGKEWNFEYGDVIILKLGMNKGNDFITDHRY